MRHFSHLSFTDRLRIEKLRKEGMSVRDIASTLHVHVSTIYRELKRGTYQHMTSELTVETRYSPDIAWTAYRANLAAKGAPLKIGNDHALAQYIEDKIVREHYSPSAVLGEIKAKNLQFKTTICLHTLYGYIDKGVFLHLTNKHLPQHGKRKKPHRYKQVRIAKVMKGESIDHRPVEINDRSSFGHWEGDTVYGRARSRRCLFVLTERMTRNEIIIPIKDRTSASVVKAFDSIERRYGRMFKKIFKSVTFDNGNEFSDCAALERSIYGGNRTKIYFCHPYSSWERGSNENQNGLIRRWHPKGTDFSNVSRKSIAHTQEWINNYPRRIFNWRCSADLFQEQVSRLND